MFARSKTSLSSILSSFGNFAEKIKYNLQKVKLTLNYFENYRSNFNPFLTLLLDIILTLFLETLERATNLNELKLKRDSQTFFADLMFSPWFEIL